MRRWLAVFMLVLLPLQFSWAAVAAYCGHETGQHAQHLGHHEHQHQHQHQHAGSVNVDNDRAPADPSAPAGFDLDCGHCHGTCVSMPATVNFAAPLSVDTHPTTPIEGAMRTLAQSPPERPQWLPLA